MICFKQKKRSNKQNKHALMKLLCPLRGRPFRSAAVRVSLPGLRPFRSAAMRVSLPGLRSSCFFSNATPRHQRNNDPTRPTTHQRNNGPTTVCFHYTRPGPPHSHRQQHTTGKTHKGFFYTRAKINTNISSVVVPCCGAGSAGLDVGPRARAAPH